MVLVAVGVGVALGVHAWPDGTGGADTEAVVGAIPDPGAVYDPDVAGERLPDGYLRMVPRDFIEPIYEPRFVSADAVGWPDDADVIGVSVNDEAKAYPISLLTAREMVVDVVGGVPVLVTWCPVCGTAMVHDRRVKDETLAFGTHGALYLNAMTWWDHGTGSIWSQPFGEAIAGPRTGQTLELLPSELTTWGAWRDAHPGSVALDAPGRATGFDPADLLIVVQLGGEVRGYPVTRLREAGVVNEVVGGVEIAVVSDPTDRERWAVYSRRTADTVLQLEVAGEVLRDVASGTTFDPARGWGLEGPLRGLVLDRLPATTSKPGFGPTRTPFFETLWPEATVWRP